MRTEKYYPLPESGDLTFLVDHKVAQTADVKIFYREAGSKHAPAIIWIIRWAASSAAGRQSGPRTKIF